MIREIKENELNKLVDLYSFLIEDRKPKVNVKLRETWDTIINDPNYHIVVAIEDNKIVSSCVCVMIPNITVDSRPYMLIENVVTNSKYRKKGLATACLDYARELAISENCYKMMLMTGHKDSETLNFYKKAGYNSEDKTAFIQWLNI